MTQVQIYFKMTNKKIKLVKNNNIFNEIYE